MGGAPRLQASPSGRVRFVPPYPPPLSPSRLSAPSGPDPSSSSTGPVSRQQAARIGVEFIRTQLRNNAPVVTNSTPQSPNARGGKAGAGRRKRKLGEDLPIGFPAAAADQSTTSQSKRDVTGQRRRRLAGDRGISDRFLADKRLQARTVDGYYDAYAKFVAWANANRVSIKDAHLDRNLRRYLQEIFFAGAPPYDARTVVHGTIFARELLKSPDTLPLSKATLAGFTTSSPEHARDPMPEEAWWLIMENLFECQGKDGRHAARALAVSYDGFFRPSEVLSLCASDVHSLTGRRRKPDMAPVSVTLRPLGDYQQGQAVPARTKGGEHDDSIAFGQSPGTPGCRPWVAGLLDKLAKSRRHGHLFPISLNRYQHLFRLATVACELQRLKLTPHCARHGAASVGYASGKMTIKDIQKRGRWKAASSVRTYEKSARLVRQLNRMTMQQRSKANALATTLPHRLQQMSP